MLIKEMKGYKNKLMARFILGTGVRREEFVNLKIQDIDL